MDSQTAGYQGDGTVIAHSRELSVFQNACPIGKVRHVDDTSSGEGGYIVGATEIRLAANATVYSELPT